LVQSRLMRLGLAVLLGALSFASAARAAGSEARFKALLKEGERLYLAAKYHDAAEMLVKAYGVKPDHRVVYNIARAYDQAGDLQESMKYYELYIDSPSGTDPTLLKRSSEAIERLKDTIAKAEAKAKAEADAKAKAEADAKAAEERAKAKAEADRQARADAESARRAQVTAVLLSRQHRRILAYTTGGLGLIAVGGGVLFGVKASSDHNKFVQAQDVAAKDTYVSKVQSEALIADIGFGVGAAALVTAVIAYPKGADPSYETGVSVSWVPVPGGIGLAGTF